MLESPVYINDFALNVQAERNFKDYWTVVFSVDGLWDAAEIVTERYKRTGRPGTLTGNQSYGGKVITVSGEIRARNLASLRRGQIELQKNTRSLDTVTMQWKLWEQVWVVGMGKKGQILDMPEEQNDDRYARTFTISYYLDRPWVVSQEINTATLDFNVASGFRRYYGPDVVSSMRVRRYGPGVDESGFLSWNYGGVVGAPFSVVNDGSADAYPIIDIHGAIQDPIITNETTGQVMTWDGLSLGAGEYLRVYTADQRLMKDDSFPYSTGFKPLQSSQDFYLTPGENVISVTPFSADIGSQIVVSWQDTFG